MAQVSLERVKPGMVLAASVNDRSGRRLMPAGLELSDRHVGILEMWGIAHVEVEGEELEEANDLEPWKIEKARTEMAARLANLDESHPFSGQLITFAVERRARTFDGEPPHETA